MHELPLAPQTEELVEILLAFYGPDDTEAVLERAEEIARHRDCPVITPYHLEWAFDELRLRGIVY